MKNGFIRRFKVFWYIIFLNAFLRSLINFFSQHIMKEILSLEQKNIIEGIRNLSRLFLELSYTAIKNIGNPL